MTDRLPPQSLEAEQMVLAACMASRDCLEVTVGLLRQGDFHRRDHGTLYAVMVSMNENSNPVTRHTVDVELRRRDLHENYPADYLRQLGTLTSATASLDYWIKQVRDAATLRGLIEAGERIVRLAYSEVDDVAELASLSEKLVQDAVDHTGSPVVDSRTLMNEVFADLERRSEHPGRIFGISTGFDMLDRITGGIEPGCLVVVGARPGQGKALSVDTLLPTPSGWTTMADVRVGDCLFDEKGNVCSVTAISDTEIKRPCFEMVFSDGSKIIADAEHEWPTHTRKNRKSEYSSSLPKNRTSPFSRDQSDKTISRRVWTTAEISATLRVNKNNRLNHAIQNTMPINLPGAALPIDPYVLGVWLGDGHSYSASITTADPEICEIIQSRGVHVGQARSPNNKEGKARVFTIGGKSGSGGCHKRACLQKTLRDVGLLCNKHIPVLYLRSSEEQRRDILAGLMDTDGYVDPRGTCEFTTTNERIAQGITELVTTLGWVVYCREYRATLKGKDCGPKWRVHFSPDKEVFQLSRKRLSQVLHRRKNCQGRFIVSASPIESVPVKCIQVDSPSRLYLAGDSMIPTHNSIMGANIAVHVAKHCGRVLFFSLEMTRMALGRRILAAESRTDSRASRTGQMLDTEWRRLGEAASRASQWPIHWDDSGDMTVPIMRSRARQVSRHGPLALIVVDYLQMVKPNGKKENRTQEVGSIVRDLKGLARDLNCVVLTLAQLNRNADGRARPVMGDLRESGEIEAAADMVCLLHQLEEAENVDLVIAKHREGETKDIPLRFTRQFNRFDERSYRHDAPIPPAEA